MNDGPVEIEIILRQNVSEEGELATEALNALAEASSRAFEATRASLDEQGAAIKALQGKLAELRKSFEQIEFDHDDVKQAAAYEMVSESIDSLSERLTDAGKRLDDMKAGSESLSSKSEILVGNIRDLNGELAALSSAGEKDTKAYEAKLAALQTCIEAEAVLLDAQKQLAEGIDMKELLEDVHELSDGLQVAGETLSDTASSSEQYSSVLREAASMTSMLASKLGVSNEALSGASRAFNAATRAGKATTQATQKFAVALGVSTAAARVLMGVFTLGISALITGGIAIIERMIAKSRDAKQAADELRESIAKAANEQLVLYEKLRVSWNRLADDMKAKERFILDNRGAFDQLGVSIGTVNDADNLFISRTEAFLSSIDQRARATAAMEMAAEKYREAWKKYQEADDRERKPTRWDRSSPLRGWYLRDGELVSLNVRAARAGEKIRDQAKKEEEEARELVSKYVELEKSAGEELKKAGIDAAENLEEGTRAWWKAKRENAQARLDAMKAAEIGGEDWNAIVEEIREAEEMEKAFNVATTGKRDEGDPGKQAGVEARKRAEAAKRLENMSVDLQRDIDAAVVATMEEGIDKKLKALEADYDARVALIKEKKREIEALEAETGVDGSRQKAMLDALAKEEKASYDAAVKAVTGASGKVLDEVWGEINSRFKTENQRRLGEIDRFYAEQISKARENGATQIEIDEITAAHKRDIDLEKQHIALETLDFETQIALKRAQIADRHVLLQSSREEKILQIQVEAARKRLQKLQEIQEAGGDTGSEIEALTVDIEAMNAELARMPLEKMKELEGIARSISFILGEVGGMLDEDTGGLVDMISGYFGGTINTGAGVARVLMGDPRGIQQAIQGFGQLVGTIKKVITANREANKEIREFNEQLAQSAIDYSLAVIRTLKDIKSETDGIFTVDYTNTLVQGMAGYNAAIVKQAGLMRQLGSETVKTGVKKKKFLGITYGTRDVYENLLKQYPDLIKKDGTLNRELAETLKKSGTLKDETVQLIDNILEAADVADEAMRAVESELQSLVGSIGTELKKALDDAFASGEDSAKAMTDSVVNMLKDISTRKLFNAVFGGIFSQLEKRMKESFGETGDRDLTDDINWFMREYGKHVEEYNRGLEQLREVISRQYDTDPFASDASREAASKRIAQASQDSIDELNGRLTFLVMKVSEIGTINATYASLGREQLAVQRAMLGQLETIADNSEFLQKLKRVDENIDRLVREGTYIKA